MTSHILFCDTLEFCCNLVAFERDCLLSIHKHWCYGVLPGAWQADADVGVLALTRAVHHATHDRHLHTLHPRIGLFPLRHAHADVSLDVLGELLEYGAVVRPQPGQAATSGMKARKPMVCRIY